MTTPQLLEYIKSQLVLGTNREVITSTLISQGWSLSDVNEGFASVSVPSPNSVSVAPVPQTQLKNKTRVLPVVITIVVLLLIGLGIFGYLKIHSQNNATAVSNYQNASSGSNLLLVNQSTTTSQLSTTTSPSNPTLIVYNDPTGVFSFSYPKGLTVTESPIHQVSTAATLIIPDGNSSDILVMDLEADASSEFPQGYYTVSSFGSIDGYPVSKYVPDFSKTHSYATAYVIDLSQYSGQDISVVVETGSVPASSSIGNIDQIENIIRSIVIHQNSIASATQTLMAKSATAQNDNAIDANVKENLENIAQAAASYQQVSSSYSGFCTSAGFTKIADSLSSTNLTCKDSPSAFAVTAPMLNAVLNGSYQCVDSTGYNGKASALNSQTACIK